MYIVKLEACEALDTCDHKHEGASVGIARKEITKRKIIITVPYYNALLAKNFHPLQQRDIVARLF